MHLIQGHILRKVHGNMVLVPPSDRDTGFNGMIVLNHTGGFVCKMLQKDTDRESLATALAQEYEVDTEQALVDLDSFLSELRSCNMLEE